jgi:predicted amidohydrolase
VRPPLTVAAVQPACAAGDASANGGVHADAVRAARARVVVFPELSLTGYELDAACVSPGDEALTPVVEACTATGSVALLGAPVRGERGRAHIATLCVSSAGVEVAYRKTWLGAAESTRFSPGDGPAVLEVDGWRLGLGICKDTGVSEHVRGTAALGIDAYVAGLVYLPEELPVQEARAVWIARQCQVHVVFASFAGPTGGGYRATAGSSAIWSPAGAVLARAGCETGGMARTSIG